MKIDLTGGELALCIGALEIGVRDLREGQEAADRLKMPMPDGVLDMASQMEELRAKLLAVGDK